MRRWSRWAAFAAAFVCVLAAGAFAADQKPPTGFLAETLTQGGQTYRYVVYVPRNYDATRQWPLILFLHGAGECGTDGWKHVGVGLGAAIVANAAAWPFIVVLPQKPELVNAWEEYDEPLMAMVAKARKDYNVDGNRLYLTGLSQGGHGTWILGARHADMWAAIAPICGYAGLPDSDPAQKLETAYPAITDPGLRALLSRSWPNGTNIHPATVDEMARDLKDMPLWAFHGEADQTVPVQESKRLVAAVKAAGGDPKITTYPGVDHNSWDRAYRTEHLGDWFLSHTKGK
jgi:predicted peptidase